MCISILTLSKLLKVIIVLAVLSNVLFLLTTDDLVSDEEPICVVYPNEMEEKTSLQTSTSVILDIKEECMGMTRSQIRKCQIPKILHSVVIGGSFSFHHYMSLKSIHDRVKPERIFLHGYDFPYGLYFNKSIEEFGIELVKSRNATHVFDHSIVFNEHKSDVVRLETLIRFGGMYFDLDVYALKDIDELLDRGYDFIIAKENDYGLNNGLMMSKRCAKFPLLWYDSYRSYDNTKWSDHSIHKPKILYNQYGLKRLKSGVHVDKSLSSNWGSNIFFKKYNETPASFWKETRLIHAFWRDHGVEYNLTSVQLLDTNLGKFARELFSS